MNSTSQIGGHDSSGTVWVFAISIGIILLLVFFLIGGCSLWSWLRHRRDPLRRADVEARATERLPGEPVDLHTVDDIIPSRKYGEVKGTRKQTTWASAESHSAEIWYGAD
ncbi:hypothetical protein Purlil1_13633 [Purpureocillium lilacinum]|uniref:Uncharacterized protein n=1 Tax=Purpureocillium lilacinum TaxID=33203 RepID=A0ABR0BDK9_PURLI|nr:hypothetical protein Purlil1_13633 [Purpureocillium lilacinum]